MEARAKKALCIRSRQGVSARLLLGCAAGLCAVHGAYASEDGAPGVVPPPPCHANPCAKEDSEAVARRGDVRNLPDALQDRLQVMAARPHSALPTQAYAEADKPSLLFQYYLLDTSGFEPNVFTKRFPGVNDAVMLTATGFDCGLSTVGSVRAVVEPKPGLPTDPNAGR